MIYYACVRTTITIDDDLMSKLKKKAFETKTSLKMVINSTLRQGLGQKRIKKQRYTCPEYLLGNPLNYNLDRALDLAESLETEEIARKLNLRK